MDEVLIQLIPAPRRCDMVYKKEAETGFFRVPVVGYGLYQVSDDIEGDVVQEVRPLTMEGDGQVNDMGPLAENFVGFEFDGKTEW